LRLVFLFWQNVTINLMKIYPGARKLIINIFGDALIIFAIYNAVRDFYGLGYRWDTKTAVLMFFLPLIVGLIVRNLGARNVY